MIGRLVAVGVLDGPSPSNTRDAVVCALSLGACPGETATPGQACVISPTVTTTGWRCQHDSLPSIGMFGHPMMRAHAATPPYHTPPPLPITFRHPCPSHATTPPYHTPPPLPITRRHPLTLKNVFSLAAHARAFITFSSSSSLPGSASASASESR